MTLEEFFQKLNNSPSWDAAITFNRTNPLPLDKCSIFPSLTEAQAYINRSDTTTYPGHILAVATTTGTNMYYVNLKSDNTYELKEFGTGGGTTETYVVSGYYLNGKFYTDSTYTVEMEKVENRIYIDKNVKTYQALYRWDNGESKFISTSLLYNESGQNTDGSMTQKAITDGVDDIKFAVSNDDEECLVLNKPW